MPRVSIGTGDKAASCPLPDGVSGAAQARCYFNGPGDPVHLYLLHLPAGATMRMASADVDRLAYVWRGIVEAGGRILESGSSFIVERSGALSVTASNMAHDGVDPDSQDGASILLFSGGQPPAQPRAGGHVHLLPFENVPRVPVNASGTSGALHSDGTCPTCELWLNENALAGRAGIPTAAEALRGTHAHPEHEIIFVTEGQIRLGAKLFEKGTALAIAAHTLYGFSPGPDGVRFITFRPGRTDTIRFAAGGDYAPSSYFDGIGQIPYLEPLPA